MKKELLERLQKTNKPAKIYAEVLEDGALKQFVDTMAQDCVIKGALMPDAHLGYTLPIGGVVATEGMIFPSFVGYDIGCGMCAIKTLFKKEEIEKYKKEIFDSIYRTIPMGFNKNKKPENWEWKSITYTQELGKRMEDLGGLGQLSSLGGGNHFIEISYDEDDFVWIVIHSGSRGIGWRTAESYMKLASGDGKAREGYFGFKTDSIDGINYISDLNFCLEFALENRKRMMEKVIQEISFYLIGEKDFSIDFKKIEDDIFINRNHNHAEFKDGLWIHRKGATHAEKGMMGVIPGNMRDGSFIVRGKGNEDSLCSSSHGAGRMLGRKEAKKTLSMDTFTEQMEGVYAKVTEDVLDESPLAYKNIFDVMDLQKDLVDVVHHLKPIINIKA